MKKTLSKPRKHHFYSQCYLRGFSEQTRKKHYLNIFDRENNRFFRSTTENIGAQRDFNRMDLETGASYELESHLSSLESKFAKTIREVDLTNDFSGENKETILYMMALFAIRNPYQRAHHDSFVDTISKLMLSMVEEAPIDSKINGIKSTLEIKEVVKNRDAYKISASRNSHIRREFEIGVSALHNLLLQRSWGLFIAPVDHHFVTSDNPVILEWMGKPKPHSPGYGQEDTFVLFPLTSQKLLFGQFNINEDTLYATPHLTAAFNTHAVINSVKQIYSSKDDFICLDQNFKNITVFSTIFSKSI